MFNLTSRGLKHTLHIIDLIPNFFAQKSDVVLKECTINGICDNMAAGKGIYSMTSLHNRVFQ